MTRLPKCYSGEGADDVTFSMDNAFWVCNWVSNMVYPRYSMMFPSLQEVRDSLEASYDKCQAEIERQATALSPQERVEFLTKYSVSKGDEMIERWRQLAYFLIVKYNDMAIKPTEGTQFKRSPYGKGARLTRPGYDKSFARELIRQTGDKFLVPKK